MLRIYPRTREREKAWGLAIYATGASLIAAPIVTAIFKKFRFVEVLYSFSLVLESVCILPQLLLLRQTTVPTVITSFYLVTLGSYRFFYILNWIVRATSREHYFDPVSVIFGIVQTALYVDFAWVYWTRQRVKLRGGGLVDSDDLRKSWLVGGLLGRGRTSADRGRDGVEDDEGDVEGQSIAGNLPNRGTRKSTAPNRWGKRGVSVSADDTLEEHQQTRSRQQNKQLSPVPNLDGEAGPRQERTGMLKPPDEFLDHDDDDEDDDNNSNNGGNPPFSLPLGDTATPNPRATTVTAATGQHQAVLNSGEAWAKHGRRQSLQK